MQDDSKPLPLLDVGKLIEHTVGVAPRPYQARIINKAYTAFLPVENGGKGLRSVLIQSPTGCLVGDSVVGFNVGGKSFTCTLREAYIHWHGGDQDAAVGQCLCGCGEATRVPQKSDASKGQIVGVPLRFVHGHQSRAARWTGKVMVRAYRGEHGIGLQPVLNVVKSGVKQVYELTLVDGRSIRGTADHPILTASGWVALSEIVPGTPVLTDRRNPEKNDMTILEHNQHHGKKDNYRNFGNSTPLLVEAAGVRKCGEEMTYDICCEQPHHTFIANGIVVHNSGKTVIGLLEVKALQDWYKSRGEELVVGWVAMRRNLLAQAENENDKKAIGADVIWISMFQKELPERLMNAKHKMLVIDEAQHDAASSCMHIHAQIKPDLILGMTATPFRTDHVKLCFDTVIVDAGIANLMKEGFLAKYDHYTIPCWTAKSVATFYLREPDKFGKSIVYFHTVDECFKCKKLLEMGGVACDVVTGDSDKEAQLQAFALNQTQVLINCYVLAEGFDCPELQTVFCRASCKGVTIQMCGRAFRRCPELEARGIPKMIVQPRRTKWPFIKTALPSTQWLWTSVTGDCDGKDVTVSQSEAACEDGDWRSLTVNPHINQINCKMLVALAGIDVVLPKYLTQKKVNKRRRGQ